MFDPASVPQPLARADDALSARIEEAGLNAPQPPEQLLYDGWLLRFSHGQARRARSVNAIAAGCLPLAQKLATCSHWYARCALPCLFRITPFSQPRELDAALAAAGFVALDETRVMAAPLQLVQPPSDAPAQEVPIDRFAHEVGRLRGSSAQQIAAHEVRLRASPLAPFAQRLLLVDGGDVVAAGQLLLEHDLLGLYDIVTRADRRGRGLATALTRELLLRGARAGARTAYLQVSADNLAAMRIYRKLGFVDRYAYWYRTPGATG
jgi:ribosomal protein S18 acetylase RimI-like enzyme